MRTLQRILGTAAGRQTNERAHAYDPRPVTAKAPPKTTTPHHHCDRGAVYPDTHRRAVLTLTH